MIGNKKDLLGIKDLAAEDIELILKNAATMKYVLQQNSKKTPHLQGKSVVTLFYENSTRTRLSFELAAKYMSASAANISVGTSSVKKGESLLDTARTVDAMGADIIIIRHSMAGAPHFVAKNVRASIINAGDGMNEHPTQSLLDLFTIQEKKGKIEGLKVAIIGDIAHSRVARSNIYALQKMGARVAVGGPSTLLPPDIERLGCEVYCSTPEALMDADVIINLRMQFERQSEGFVPSNREYSRFFGLDEKRLIYAKPDVLVMHPGPVNRGIEITSEVADSDFSAIDEQVTNGVAVRMALLYMLARKGGSNEASN
ncbi:MAG: aspartate carbamoyltransferase catalytic subunit [Ruminococcaceae bacterium]|nr:aspartate carbamoyltransferase catalytic subunit [Oscillospiraceae bacterium]